VTPAPIATRCPFRRAGVVVTPYAWSLCNVLELAALPSAVPCARLHAGIWCGSGDRTAWPGRRVADQRTGDQRCAGHGGTGGPAGCRPAVVERSRARPDRSMGCRPAAASTQTSRKGRGARSPSRGGRGLFLVSVLSARWNWYLTQLPEGKVVWCELEDERPEHVAVDRLPGSHTCRGGYPAPCMPARLRRGTIRMCCAGSGMASAI